MGTKDPSGRPRIALVVDDSADTRDITSIVLETAGYATERAANGLTAIRLARELLPDVVVLDLAMPGLDGWEVARLLKVDPHTRAIRILAFTGCAEASALRRARHSGCDAVLTKPSSPEEIRTAVRLLLEGELELES